MTGLTLGTTYKIEVTSLNAIGESLKSPPLTTLFSNTPSQPATLVLTSTDAPSIKASWTVPSSLNGDVIRGYKLYIDDGEGGDYIMIYDGTNFANVYSYTIAGSDILQCGVIYNLKITALNSAGESIPTEG